MWFCEICACARLVIVNETHLFMFLNKSVFLNESFEWMFCLVSECFELIGCINDYPEVIDSFDTDVVWKGSILE